MIPDMKPDCNNRTWTPTVTKGGLEVHLVGPPGCGKTLLADAIMAALDGEHELAYSRFEALRKINGAAKIEFFESQFLQEPDEFDPTKIKVDPQFLPLAPGVYDCNIDYVDGELMMTNITPTYSSPKLKAKPERPPILPSSPDLDDEIPF